MKKFLRIGGVVVAVVALGIVLGPRAVVVPTLEEATLPDDLDAYLADTEARFADLVPGTEKTIVWADSARRQTALSVVYLHGFSATRQETRPLSDTLAARLGANLYYPRLAGHGRPPEAMTDASANDWLNDAAEALAVGRRLGRRVVLVGTSTGGTLAVWLAAQPDLAEALLAVVLISPNFGPKDADAAKLLWPWGKTLARLLAGPYHQWEPKNDRQARYWTTRYHTDVLVAMMSLVDLVDNTDLGAIETPVLTIYSPNDQVVDPALIEAHHPEIGASYKQLVPLDSVGDPSNHVLAGAILSPDETAPIARIILDFLKPLME